MTDIPTLTPLPDPPQRGQDAAVFAALADAFLDALPGMATEINAFGAQLVQATQERVTNAAAASYQGAAQAAQDAANARDAAQAAAGSVNASQLVHRSGDEAIAGSKNFTGAILLAGVALKAAATFDEMAIADFFAGANGKLVSVAKAWAAAVPVALTDAPTIAVDLSTFLNATVTLAGNRTLGAPANAKPGQTGMIEIKQDATGNRTLAFASGWTLGSYVPTLSTAASARDVLYFEVLSDGKVDAYLSKAR